MKVHLPPISPKKFINLKSKDSHHLSPKWQYSISNYNLLEKSIRTNNVSQFLGDTRIYTEPTANTTEEDDLMMEEKKEIVDNLLAIRKKLNEIREQTEKKTQEMNKVKNELERIKENEENNVTRIENSHFKAEQLKVALQLQKSKIEEALYIQSTYEIMLTRLKKDRIADQIKINNYETEYNRKYHELTQKLYEVSKQSEFYTKTRHFAQDVKKHIEEGNQRNEENLHLLEQTLYAREEYETRRELRVEHIQNIAADAAAEVDDDQKQWTELFSTHQFLHLLLKSKIDRQIKRYEDTEKAFQKMKACTGLTNLNEITTRFLNREEKYSELLMSIAESENKVNEQKKIKEQMETKIKELKDKIMSIEKLKEEKKDEKELLAETQYELNIKNESFKKAKLVLISAHKWAVRTLMKLNKAQKITKDDVVNYPQEKMAEVFLKLIETVKANTGVLKEKASEELFNQVDKFNIDDVTMNKDFIAKNIRSKPFYTPIIPIIEQNAELKTHHTILEEEFKKSE